MIHICLQFHDALELLLRRMQLAAIALCSLFLLLGMHASEFAEIVEGPEIPDNSLKNDLQVDQSSKGAS